MMRLPLLAVFALAAAETPKPCKSDGDCPKGTHYCRVAVAASGVECDTKAKTCAKLSVRGESCGGSGKDCFRNKCKGDLVCRANGVDAKLPGTCAKQCDVDGKKVFEGWTGPAKDAKDWCHTRYCDGSSGKTDVGELKTTGDAGKTCPTDIATGLRCCVGAGKKGQVCCGATGAWLTPDGKATCGHVLAEAGSKAAPFSKTCTDACPATVKPAPGTPAHDDGWKGPDARDGKWCNTCVCALTKLQCTERKCPTLMCCPPGDKTPKAEQVCCGATGKWVTKDAKGMVTCSGVTKKYSAGLKEEPFHAECTTTRECKFFSNVAVTVAHTKKAFNPRVGQGCNECTCTDGTLTCDRKKCDAPKCCDPTLKPKEAAVCCGLTGLWVKVDAANKCGSYATQVKPAAAGYPFFKACDAQCAVNTAVGGPKEKVPLGWTGAKQSTKAVTAKWCDTCKCAVAAGAPKGAAPVVTCTTHAACPAVKCCPGPAPSGDYKCCGVTRRWVKVVDGKVQCAGVSVSAKSAAAPLGVVCDKKRQCTLPGGAVLDDGQSGPDAGAQWCNRCRCQGGKPQCTKYKCTKKCCKAKMPAGGTYRCCGANGEWVPKDADDKYRCGGALVADGAEQLYPGKGKDAEKGICAPVLPADTKCKLHNAAGTEVELGWTGSGLGDKWCHTCKCSAADLGKAVSCPATPAKCPEQAELLCCAAKQVGKRDVCCGLTGQWMSNDAMCGPVDLKLARLLRPVAPLTKGCNRCGLSPTEFVAPGWTGRVPGDNWCNKCHCLTSGKLACTKTKCPPLQCCRAATKPAKGASQCCGPTGTWVTEVVKGKLTCAGHTIASTEAAPKKPFNTVACPTAKTCTIPGVKGTVHVGWIGRVACNFCYCQAAGVYRCSKRVCRK